MKKRNILNRVAVVLVSAFVTVSLQAADKKATTTVKTSSGATFKVIPAESHVNWTGKKVTGSHVGTIDLKSGQLMTSTDNFVTGGSFVIDMTTIKDTDLTDDDMNGKLIGHLKSDDFFGVDKNPTASYEITKVTRIADAKPSLPNYTFDGNLTIKGVTQPLTVFATVLIDGAMLSATAHEIKIDRTLYGIHYGSAKFFDKIGDKAIYDEFFLDVSLVAKKS